MMAAMQKADDALLLHATFTALPGASCASFTLAVPLIPATSSSGLSPPFVLHLRGPSGVGKTQTALALLSGAPPRGMSLNLNWHASIPAASRVGMLFQNGVLIDELSVGANLALAGGDPTSSSIEALLAAVNLERSALEKMPSELSGGMLRRAALAQLLCQRKRLIILDEPFAGLDDGAAAGVAEALLRVAREGVALVLISHRERWCAALSPSCSVDLRVAAEGHVAPRRRATPIDCGRRSVARAGDYILLSAPLIITTFLAAGGAIAMLFGDALSRTEITPSLLAVLDEEALSWPPPMRALIAIARAKVSALAARYVPRLKASVYCAGLAHLTVLEVAPLLTALLLAGRIGGSFAGEVATMQATEQNRLLRTIGVSPLRWSLAPAVAAALVAAPLLTALGAAVALGVAAFVFEGYGLGVRAEFVTRAWGVVAAPGTTWWHYAPFVLTYRSTAYMAIIIAVAAACAQWHPRLSPRDVPRVITWAVVGAGLLVVCADFLFSIILVRVGLATNGIEVLANAGHAVMLNATANLTSASSSTAAAALGSAAEL